MSKNIVTVFSVWLLFSILFPSDYAHSQKWTINTIKSLPDSSFALVETKKDKTKVRHFPYKDIYGRVDINHLLPRHF